jgi:hypothetical protein
MSTVEKSSSAYSSNTVEESKIKGTNTVEKSSNFDCTSTLEECSNAIGISTLQECSSANGASSVQENNSFGNRGFAKINDSVNGKEIFNCDKHSTYKALSSCHYESIPTKYEQLSSYEEIKVSNKFHQSQEDESKCLIIETSAQSLMRAVDRSLKANDQPTTSVAVSQCEGPQLNYCSNANTDCSCESTVSTARPDVKITNKSVTNKTDYFGQNEQINLPVDGYEEIHDTENRPMPESSITACSSSTQTQVNSKTRRNTRLFYIKTT